MSISPETIAQLRGELQAARAAGYSLSDIADQLGARGVAISASTLGSYLRTTGHHNPAEPRGRRRRRGTAATMATG